MHRVGLHLRKLSVLSQFSLKPECRINVPTLIFIPSTSQYRLRMIVTSTVSPVLKIGLQLLGVWPGVSYSIPYWLIYVFSLLIVQFFQYRYLFEHIEISELSNLVDSLPAALEFSLTIFKVTSFWIHRRVVHQLLAAMDNDWRECVDIDHLRMMTVKANTSYFCSNVMFGINLISGVVYMLGNYAIRLVYLSGDDNDTLRQLPLKVQFPIEAQQSPIFELLAVTLFLHGMLNLCTLSILNALISTLVLHVSGQIDIVCRDFKTMSTKVLPYETSTSILGTLIERHNRIFSFSNNIEKLFSFIALIQVTWNIIVICSLGFIVIISLYIETGVTITIVKSFFAYLAVIAEVLILCIAGEYLNLKSKSIAEAAYESLWYDLPSNERKIMTLIIMRSQKQLVITAGRITNLSLETFTNIIKASASYISVLHAMY